MNFRAIRFLIAIATAALVAQTPSFEVASIKPAKEFSPPSFALSADDSYRPTGGRLFAVFPLQTYITFAYKLSLTPEQRQAMLAHLPGWVAMDFYEIEARAPDTNPTKDQMRLMVQSLLAERFKLAVHFETHETAVFALTLAKPGKLGPKLREHSGDPPCDALAAPPRIISADKPGDFVPPCDTYVLFRMGGTNRWGSRHTTMEMLAGAIPGVGTIGRPVIDRTGLTGRFDFTLEWTPESNNPAAPAPGAAPDPQGPSFLDALREQLGLKLESTRAQVRILVVDHVERPSEN